MTKKIFRGSRNQLYTRMKGSPLPALSSGREARKTTGEYYPFYTNRSFLYLTSLGGRGFVAFSS